MEKKIIMQEGKDRFNALCDQVTASLNEDVAAMSEKLGLTFSTLEQVRRFDGKALAVFIANSKAALLGKASEAKTFVPAEIRQFYDRTFKHTEDEVKPLITDIANRLQQLESKGLKPQWRNGKMVMDEKEKERLATEFATFRFTDEQHEYATLLENVAAAYNEVRDYEQRHGFNLWTAGHGGNNATVQDIETVLRRQDGSFSLPARTFFNLVVRGQVCYNADQAAKVRADIDKDDEGE